MDPLRRTLLWASQNQWLEQRFRRARFAQRAVSRFMPGEDADAALDAADTLSRADLRSVLTLLGENVTASKQATDVSEHYGDVLDRIAARRIPAQISVKLTQLGLDLDPDNTYHLLTRLLAHAAARDNFVWVDMESSRDTDVTLDLFERAREVHANVGICIQSYLRRSADDLERLMQHRPAIRLVKGAYLEPASLAFPRKRDVDWNYYELAVRLLDGVADGSAGMPAFATHDAPLLERVLRAAEAKGVARDAFEVQMLFGIGQVHQRQLAADGYTVRVLISYGDAWYPWYVRRLAERPANVWFVLRSALRH